MDNLCGYIRENFTLSGEAIRLIDNIGDYASCHFENHDGTPTEEGVSFVERLIGNAIGLEKSEIQEHWHN